ncbi:P-type DNA transfer protein VirB5 [Photobacterium damselae subsp. piscicida]|uniref:P-type DNA transfer protein VirB5 n=1 Tax=Photobacterium damsela subsp. piscicida TaxID=38294 RepID=A0A7L8A8L8_PHODP|nr:P-type DNA transfer protein VirB5 [Photobacterium damselae]MBE8127172.1 P-type DNA transfer protein VirB5 [Photobacterium damselae subsp. piscicida]MBE8127194.1 P-type DNA transfer protein VirB5 [Photobacterium damselae subsp. piscicida]PSW76527.1 P-type DNA transfer protein VirB5 [Photobacterium damselae]QOD54952.1 P-type DNA transfer protein VirB5 [Photobacterium damselae subsp. piscicida]QOD58302.1 P-type DNA transfer protein VirB5 [Photobacterium damselae subsp. piscicida]
MKKHLIAAALAAVVVMPTHAGIPVIIVADIPTQIYQIQNYGQMLKDYATMVEQLEQMRRQFTQMEKEFTSITGARNLGDILNNPHFKQYLPDDWQRIYDGVRNNGYASLSGTAKALRDASKVFDACENINNPTEKRICNAKAVKPAQDQAFAQAAYSKSQERVSQIEGLMQEINRTRDPKAIAEINGRIQAEQALIQNEQTKLSLYQASAEAEERILKQQEDESAMKLLSSRNFGTIVPPMEF